MIELFDPAAGTARTALRPAFPASATIGADPPDRHVERSRYPVLRLARRDVQMCVMHLAAFAAEKRAAHAIDGGRHRRKVDDDFVGKAVRLVAAVVTRQHGDAIATERPECVSAHQLWLR